jgi:hypothetical protein
LPLGFLMFGVTVLGFTRRKAGRSLARREYPKLAAKLGLTFEAPLRGDEVGCIKGEIEGIRVRIESDERCRIVCFPLGDVGLDVRNYEHHKRTPEGYESLSLQSLAEDRWAKNRFAREDLDIDARVVALRRVLDSTNPERDRLKGFTVDAEKIECVFEFGKPSYLPAPVAARVLPAMLELARLATPQRERAAS